ncbi:PHB depolymerase family esterase [Archangium sp.]|uniref:alpha/beta hydrolase family esterase n=1 Tax=Archangium sp. TaxID=1872627 RepID=UPI002D3E683E|nr:PHB depolymerase family esterase [Archangium sp.]HYO60242.1 PHB depolymerase family esterase [Archangium sp.]
MIARNSLLNVLGAAALLFTAPACSDRTTDPGPETEPPPQVPNFGPPAAPAPAPLPERAFCSGLTVGPGTYDWNVTHEGRTRLYRVHVPPGYDPAAPTPAVLAFHGFGSNEQEQEGLSRMSQEADAQGFIAVYPRGLNQTEVTGNADPRYEDTRSWNAGVCCGPSQISRVDDVAFVDALLADLDTRVCLDTKRIYATGLSNGGFFSYRLACERSGQIAAIAPVAGMEGFAPCSPVRPVSVMHFHGTDDRTIYYQGGNNIPFGGPYPSAQDSVARWASRDVCTGDTLSTYDQGDSSCRTYTHCGQDTAVTLCTVQGGGHTWPGGLIPPEYGHTTQDLDATREMWRFFETHPRP